MPRIPKKLRAKYKLNHCLIIRDKLKVSILFFLTTSPNSLARVLIITFYTYDHSTYRLAMLLGGLPSFAIGEAESINHECISENYYDIEEIRKHDTLLSQHTTVIMVILPPLFRMQDFFVLWMHIFGTILTKTAHNLVLKHRE